MSIAAFKSKHKYSETSKMVRQVNITNVMKALPKLNPKYCNYNLPGQDL